MTNIVTAVPAVAVGGRQGRGGGDDHRATEVTAQNVRRRLRASSVTVGQSEGTFRNGRHTPSRPLCPPHTCSDTSSPLLIEARCHASYSRASVTPHTLRHHPHTAAEYSPPHRTPNFTPTRTGMFRTSAASFSSSRSVDLFDEKEQITIVNTSAHRSNISRTALSVRHSLAMSRT